MVGILRGWVTTSAEGSDRRRRRQEFFSNTSPAYLDEIAKSYFSTQWRKDAKFYRLVFMTL
jgi:hypothetical protein